MRATLRFLYSAGLALAPNDLSPRLVSIPYGHSSSTAAARGKASRRSGVVDVLGKGPVVRILPLHPTARSSHPKVAVLSRHLVFCLPCS